MLSVELIPQLIQRLLPAGDTPEVLDGEVLEESVSSKEFLHNLAAFVDPAIGVVQLDQQVTRQSWRSCSAR